MTANISSVAQSGFANAASYDTHRPSYPPEAVSALIKHLDIDNVLNGRVVDLAAGTGKFTELLSQRPEDYEIIAVEPHTGMREVLVKKGLKGVKVIDGTATNMKDVGTGWADGVVVAQVRRDHVHQRASPQTECGVLRRLFTGKPPILLRRSK